MNFCLQTEMDPESGAPKDELSADTLTWFKSLGVSYQKLSEVLAAGPCPKVEPLILNQIYISFQHFSYFVRFMRR